MVNKHSCNIIARVFFHYKSAWDCIQHSNTYCIQDTLSSRATLGLPPLGRVRRASKGILHTTTRIALQLCLYTGVTGWNDSFHFITPRESHITFTYYEINFLDCLTHCLYTRYPIVTRALGLLPALVMAECIQPPPLYARYICSRAHSAQRLNSSH